jgi:molecular chaperone GrpE (heat shock protein)
MYVTSILALVVVTTVFSFPLPSIRNKVYPSASTTSTLSITQQQFFHSAKFHHFRIFSSPDNTESEVDQAEETEDGDKTESDDLPTIEEQPVKAVEPPALTPEQLAELELIATYEKDIKSLEQQLASQRNKVRELKAQQFERGKNGYHLVQSQVQEFLRKKDQELKDLISKNKKEVVFKTVSLLDTLNQIPQQVPFTTPREQKMHEDFAVLIRSTRIALTKYGFSEFSPGNKIFIF